LYILEKLQNFSRELGGRVVQDIWFMTINKPPIITTESIGYMYRGGMLLLHHPKVNFFDGRQSMEVIF
jgi:hypothetical protein